MTRGTWIVLSGTQGILNQEFFPDVDGSEVDFTQELIKLLQSGSWILMPGDTLTFVEGESYVG